MADPIHVQAPDGSVVQFPAGTPDTVIVSVMQQNYPAGKTASASGGPAASGATPPPETAMAPVFGEEPDLSALAKQSGPAPEMPYGEQMRHLVGSADNAVRAVANGIPFADRFASGMGALTGIGGELGNYSGNLEKQRAQDKQLQDAAPIANTAAHLVGGSLLPVGVFGAVAKPASLYAKTLAGMLTGGAIGGAQGISDTPDLTNLSDAAIHGAKGAGIGAALGLSIPLAARGIGAGYNAVANYFRGNADNMSRGASKILVDALLADGPQAVRSSVARLGDDAMLADAGPAMLGKAQGVTLNSDEARSVMSGALNARNDATNARIMGDVNRTLGPAEDPQTVTNAIRGHRSELDNAAYPKALESAPSVQIEPIMADLAKRIEQAPTGSMEHRALTNLQKMLTREEQEAAAVAPTGKGAASVAPVGDDPTTAALRSKYGDAVADAFAKQQAKPAQEQPLSLLQFIASKGGLKPDPELEAIGLAFGHRAQVPGKPGFFNVVGKDGQRVDRMREAVEEAGYLRGSERGTSTPAEFLDAIEAELRGQKRYPEGFEGYKTKREGVARSEREQHEYDKSTQGLEDDLRSAGHGQIGPDVRERAVNLMREKSLSPDEAVDRAVTQLEHESSFPGGKPSGASPPPSGGQANTVVPHDSASLLHKIKGELDNVIEYDAPGLGVPAGALQRQQGALKLMRGAINDTLERQVPGYREANRRSAALAKRAEAVEAGTQYLGSGKTTPSPERFATEFEPLSQGEKIAFGKGSRGNIERVLGTKANDLQALRGELQGEGGWNTAKIATVHGQGAADDLMASVERNLKFRDTHNKVVENSQTAQRTAAAKALKPDPSTETPLLNPNMSLTGLLATGAKKTANWVANGMRPDQTRHYGEAARVLSAQGAERDAHLQALIDALSRRGENAAAAPAIGNRAALAASLLANDYLRYRLREQ